MKTPAARPCMPETAAQALSPRSACTGAVMRKRNPPTRASTPRPTKYALPRSPWVVSERSRRRPCGGSPSTCVVVMGLYHLFLWAAGPVFPVSHSVWSREGRSTSGISLILRDRYRSTDAGADVYYTREGRQEMATNAALAKGLRAVQQI